MPVDALFSTAVYRGSLVNPKSIQLKELRREAMMLAEKDQEGLAWSQENYPRGYTSYGSLDQLHLFSETFRGLKTKLDKAVAAYIKTLGLQVKTSEIQMTRMWVNVMEQGCSHPMHLHPLSVVSGTFYIQTPQNTAALRFEDPRLNSFMARPLAKAAKGQRSAYHHSHRPRSGEVILFESWLRHEVPTQNSKSPRISISFNYDWVSG